MSPKMNLVKNIVLFSLSFTFALSSASQYSVQDKDDFDQKLKDAGSKLVVVNFYATWCKPCKETNSKINEMSLILDHVVFLNVDVDDCEEVATVYNIRVMPTFIFIKSGEKMQEFSGANADKVKELIDEYK